MTDRRRLIALVPARSGSTRVRGKNVRPLAGHPLIAYTIASAHEAGLFERVVVSTDSDEIAAVARHYGAEVPFLRPPEFATATSPDIEWVRHALAELGDDGLEAFALLRPTSPFRTAQTIRRAWEQLARVSETQPADSLRAVELCRQHPGKMWVLESDLMRPLLEGSIDGVPWHSSQYQALPRVYVQNSSLEIAWTKAVAEHGSIAGEVVVPFLTEGLEGFSIDYDTDWERAEAIAASGEATLPSVPQQPYAAPAAATP
jgi:CMP-N,N'-diacetyllegionaminic acid synthase